MARRNWNHLPPLVFRHLLDYQYGECSRYPSFASRVTLRETEKLKSQGPHGWSPPAHCGICQTTSAAGSDACSHCTWSPPNGVGLGNSAATCREGQQERHVSQKQVHKARTDTATLKVSSPMGPKSEGIWVVSLIYMKSILNWFLPSACLPQKSPGKAGDSPTSGLCKGPPCIKRFPSLGHFLRLSIFNIVFTPEIKEPQVPTSLEKSGCGRFTSALS